MVFIEMIPVRTTTSRPQCDKTCLRGFRQSETQTSLLSYKYYSKTCLKRLLKKKIKNWFSRPIIAKCSSKVLQNAPKEHSAILLTFIKVPFVFKTLVLSIFEWPLKIGFTVDRKLKFHL